MTSVPTYSPSARGQCAGCGKVVKRTAKSAAVQYCRPCRATGMARSGCGTVGGYSAGCRCQDCRDAVAAIVRQNSTRRRVNADPTLLERPRCVEDGCNYEATSSRVPRCRGCHVRHQRGLVATGRKQCTMCGEVKSVDQFTQSSGKIRSECKPCGAEAQREWRKRNPEYMRDYMRLANQRRGYRRKSLYGMSPEDVEQMLADQDGSCAICFRPVSLDKVNIDHCHASGKVRAILCRSCNLALGFMQDDPERIERAASYVRLHATG